MDLTTNLGDYILHFIPSHLMVDSMPSHDNNLASFGVFSLNVKPILMVFSILANEHLRIHSTCM